MADGFSGGTSHFEGCNEVVEGLCSWEVFRLLIYPFLDVRR